jgi:hypothetical protein
MRVTGLAYAVLPCFADLEKSFWESSLIFFDCISGRSGSHKAVLHCSASRLDSPQVVFVKECF